MESVLESAPGALSSFSQPIGIPFAPGNCLIAPQSRAAGAGEGGEAPHMAARHSLTENNSYVAHTTNFGTLDFFWSHFTLFALKMKLFHLGP